MKPGFFQNEQLAELPPETRLLYIGLWLMADREGRLEDRPKRIKMQVFPADTYDVDPMLDALAGQGLVIRYEVEGERYIAIPKFLEHQRPHHQEKPSVIPPPEELRTKERSGSHQGTSQSALNPDTGYLNTDSIESGRARANRIPDDFTLTPERRAVAEAEKVPAERTFAKFCDYWRAESGQKARKRDWDATWRNWCRREAERSPVTRATDTYHDELRRAVRAHDG